MTHYKTLGVEKTATEEEIKKAYRKLAMKYHPDRTQGDKAKEEKFKEIQVAYDTLSNAGKRAVYDQESEPRSYGGDTGYQSGFSNFERGSNFEEFFGNYFNRKYTEPQRSNSFAVNLTFWEAVRGVKKSFSTTLTHQSGKKTVEEFEVNLPSGVESGEVYQVQSESGQQYLIQVIAPEKSEDGMYRREGNDLYTVLSVSFTTAILGRKYTFNHWDSDLEITVPPGIQSGQKLRLKSKGIKAEPKFGDLYIEIRVELPKNLTREQKELIEQMQAKFPFKDNLDKINGSWK